LGWPRGCAVPTPLAGVVPGHLPPRPEAPAPRVRLMVAMGYGEETRFDADLPMPQTQGSDSVFHALLLRVLGWGPCPPRPFSPHCRPPAVPTKKSSFPWFCPGPPFLLKTLFGFFFLLSSLLHSLLISAPALGPHPFFSLSFPFFSFCPVPSPPPSWQSQLLFCGWPEKNPAPAPAFASFPSGLGGFNFA